MSGVGFRSHENEFEIVTGNVLFLPPPTVLTKTSWSKYMEVFLTLPLE